MISCFSFYDRMARHDNLLCWRERFRHGLQRLSSHWRGNRVFMAFYIFSVAASFLPFNWWQVWNVFFSITLFSPSKCNSDWVVVGGHLKWTPQRPCLGNEIACDMAFCHVAPQCILMISSTWHSSALQDSHSDTRLTRLTAHSLHCLLFVSFFLYFL